MFLTHKEFLERMQGPPLILPYPDSNRELDDLLDGNNRPGKRRYSTLKRVITAKDKAKKIVRQSIAVHQAGLYFLIKEEKIVYVGRTKGVFSRISGHLKNKKFDRFTFLEEEDPKERARLEKSYIRMFRPEYNISGTGLRRVPNP